MPTDPHAAELRSRAAELRRLAMHLDGTPLATVLERAGPDTWVSPHADGAPRAARRRSAPARRRRRRPAPPRPLPRAPGGGARGGERAGRPMTELRYDPVRLPPLRARPRPPLAPPLAARSADPAAARRCVSPLRPAPPSSTGGCRRSTACWRRTRCSRGPRALRRGRAARAAPSSAAGVAGQALELAAGYRDELVADLIAALRRRRVRRRRDGRVLRDARRRPTCCAS